MNLGQFITAKDSDSGSSRKREKQAAFVGCIFGGSFELGHHLHAIVM